MASAECSEERWRQQARALASRVRKAQHMVVYSGAGISASAGVKTFRGPTSGTLLHVREDLNDAVLPTLSHRALTALVQKGFVKHITTSNHDGLHIKAGTPPENVTEMFGCAYVEQCRKCNRDIRRSTAVPSLNRRCEYCGSKLKKSGCRYGEAIADKPWTRGCEEASKCDLSLSLGSGLHTSPFTLDAFVGRADHCAVVLWGPTALEGAEHDPEHVERIVCKCDEFMEELCRELQVDVPPIEFQQQFRVRWRWESDAKRNLLIRVVPFNLNEGITFASTCVLTCGESVRELERSRTWTFECDGVALPVEDDSFQASFTPEEAYGEVDDVIVHVKVSRDAMEGEAVGQFYFTT